MEQKIEIEKEVVIGFVVTMVKGGQFRTRPIIGSWEGYFDIDPIDETMFKEKVIGVLPAPQNTFHVMGCGLPDAHSLGYEFAGAFHPDWEETYLETNKEQEEYDDLFANGTGVSKSQQQQFEILRKILRETMDSHGGEAPEEIILAAANTIGFDETRVLDMLKRLKTQGELDSPRKGVYRLL